MPEAMKPLRGARVSVAATGATVSAHERYLHGVPLNERVARLKNGEAEPEPATPSMPLPSPGVRSLDNDDREHLRRLQFEPGWAVFLQLLDNLILAQEHAVRQLSRIDPLSNEHKVASECAYLAMAERFRKLVISTIDAEIAKLETQEQGDDADMGD